jgi:hypothetical protein
LHTEASRLWSRGIIYVQTDSKSKYDSISNSMVKQGHHLKDGDVVLRSVDPDGKDSSGLYSWKVAKLLYTPPLGIDDLKLGEEYAVWVHQDQKVRPFKLVGMDLDAKVCQRVVGNVSSPYSKSNFLRSSVRSLTSSAPMRRK